MRSYAVRSFVAAALAVSIAVPAAAQLPATQSAAPRQAVSAPADSAQAFYFRYRIALSTAMAMADLKPWMTTRGYTSAMKVPAEKQPAMFATLKQMNASIARVEVLDRVNNRDTVVLRLKGFDRQSNGTMFGAAVVVRERGNWKLGRESWQDRP